MACIPIDNPSTAGPAQANFLSIGPTVPDGARRRPALPCPTCGMCPTCGKSAFRPLVKMPTYDPATTWGGTVPNTDETGHGEGKPI